MDATRREKRLKRSTWTREKPQKLTVWLEVCSKAVKDEMIPLPELLQWIDDNTPNGVNREDVMVYFVHYDEPYYYDEVLTGVDMCLMVREK
jgi:hypothetical protein